LTFARGANTVSALGSYIHHQTSDNSPALPAGAPSTHVVNSSKLVHTSPHAVAQLVSEILEAHASQAFKLRIKNLSLTASASNDAKDVDAVVTTLESEGAALVASARIDPAKQLFDPRKSYILLGGSSELGVRIADWMARHGARHIFMTSQRGPKGLTKLDGLYNHHWRLKGVEIEVIAADAVSKADTQALVEKASAGPIGGVFVMTVVLRDAKFTNPVPGLIRRRVHIQGYCAQHPYRVRRPGQVGLHPPLLDHRLRIRQRRQAAYFASQLYLDRAAEVVPNTISMSFPPITNSGIFKRLVLASKGKANTAQLTKTGMTTAQVCNFIGDSLIRQIVHYVPMLAINDVTETFPSCEPKPYGHLLPTQYLLANAAGGKGGNVAETPATLLATFLSMDVEQITENALITGFGLDSLGGEYSAITLCQIVVS
jgi:hypothetical protein